MRGTHRPVILDDEFPRFIPACAGNTGKNAIAPITEPVHPRVCGEHKENDCRPEFVNGSSPRVRGTRNLVCCEHRTSRFIPACAGNTIAQRVEQIRSPVHPRVCGEHFIPENASTRPFGSSPRVRGTRLRLFFRTLLPGFIPACAGNTPYPCRRTSLSAVHPRVCGEHYVGYVLTCPATGSSPRVRGTPCVSFKPYPLSRFIPACAGNTLITCPSLSLYPVHPRVCGEHSMRRAPRR